MHGLLHSVSPTLQQATTEPPLETPGYPQASLGQSLVGSLLLSPGSWCTRFWLCPPRVYFPVLSKFWQLYGGVNGDLLWEGLWHTQVCCTQSPCPCGSPLLTHTSRGNAQTVLCQSLWGPWVLVRTRFVWALLASLTEMEFDSKREFTPPIILLGLLLCHGTWGISAQPTPAPTVLLGFLWPWMWSISSGLLQQSTATTPDLGCGVSPLGAQYMFNDYVFLCLFLSAGFLGSIQGALPQSFH